MNAEATPEQKKIITEDICKNMLITACPGSGKSATIANRVSFLLTQAVAPEKIRIMTFTNKCADDLREKINIDNISTIDSFCFQLCDKYALIDRDIDFIYSPDDYKFLVYEHLSKIDFSSHFAYVFIDEVQDIDDIQYNIIKKMNDDKCIIYMTGDDKQNIYKFRNTSNMYINRYNDFFSDIHPHRLTVNFRSRPRVLEALNEIERCFPCKAAPVLSRCNPLRDFEGELGSVEFIKINHVYNYGKKINEIILTNKLAYKDTCIVSRNNNLLNSVKIFFIRNHIRDVHFNTIHSAKGGEWDNVFFIGLNDCIIPNPRSDFDEEMRLYYVGCSRARSKLFMMFHLSPSCFLSFHKQFRMDHKKQMNTALSTPCDDSVDSERFRIVEKMTQVKNVRNQILQTHNFKRVEYGRIKPPKYFSDNNIADEFFQMLYLYYMRGFCRCREDRVIVIADYMNRIKKKLEKGNVYLQQKKKILDESYNNFLSEKASVDVKQDLYNISCAISFLARKEKMDGFFSPGGDREIPRVLDSALADMDVFISRNKDTFCIDATREFDLVSTCGQKMLIFNHMGTQNLLDILVNKNLVDRFPHKYVFNLLNNSLFHIERTVETDNN